MSVFRSLLFSAVTNTTDWLGGTDDTRNAIFGYLLGRLAVDTDHVSYAADYLTCNLLHPTGFTALQDGAFGWLTFPADVIGPTEIDIEGIGPVDLKTHDGNALAASDYLSGEAVLVAYDDNAGFMRVLSKIPSLVGPIGIQTIGTSGSYVPTTGTLFAVVIGQAAGGGGQSATAANPNGVGGQAGETRFGVFPITSSVAVTIGAPGSGGVAAGTPQEGSPAADSSFGAHMVCAGGNGGGIAGTPTGSGGRVIAPIGAPTETAGGLMRGGSCLFGRGGEQMAYSQSSVISAQDGEGYGSGGCGATSNGNAAGGDGAPGFFIIIEFGTV